MPDTRGPGGVEQEAIAVQAVALSAWEEDGWDDESDWQNACRL